MESQTPLPNVRVIKNGAKTVQKVLKEHHQWRWVKSDNDSLNYSINMLFPLKHKRASVMQKCGSMYNFNLQSIIIYLTRLLLQMIQESVTSSHIDLALSYVEWGGGSWSSFLQFPWLEDIPWMHLVIEGPKSYRQKLKRK